MAASNEQFHSFYFCFFFFDIFDFSFVLFVLVFWLIFFGEVGRCCHHKLVPPSPFPEFPLPPYRYRTMESAGIIDEIATFGFSPPITHRPTWGDLV